MRTFEDAEALADMILNPMALNTHKRRQLKQLLTKMGIHRISVMRESDRPYVMDRQTVKRNKMAAGLSPARTHGFKTNFGRPFLLGKLPPQDVTSPLAKLGLSLRDLLRFTLKQPTRTWRPFVLLGLLCLKTASLRRNGIRQLTRKITSTE